MKIVLALNVLNEEKNIARILSAYNGWVDKTIIVDGGSTDKTIEIANGFDGVHIMHYPAYGTALDGSMLNNITEQVKYLIDWADDLNADWIVYDDCDCVPNYLLREQGKYHIENSTFTTIFVPRLYIYGQDKYFPNMTMDINGKYIPSLWAWNASYALEFEDSLRHLTIKNLPNHARTEIYPPYCLLHYFAPDEETIQRKMEMQRKLVGHDVQHPLQFGGKLEDLPEWARLER